MKVARYIGSGEIAIFNEPEPGLPPGGLVVRTEACGLCSGELMDWYMDQKIPHVLGHEVSGIVEESADDRFPVGVRIAPHHHAACMVCDYCLRGLYVHCPQWKRTKLAPGGMAEMFAVSADNLTDTLLVDDLRPIDAALVEPLGCVIKSIRSLGAVPQRKGAVAVVGLGVMGLMHMFLLSGAVGYEVNSSRLEWAKKVGLNAAKPTQAEAADAVIVCPGTPSAVEFAAKIVSPGGTIVLFAPFAPTEAQVLPFNDLYFKDVKLACSYSCGPIDTAAAAEMLRAGKLRAEQVVSHMIAIEDLPNAYQAMKRGEILKPMVLF